MSLFGERMCGRGGPCAALAALIDALFPREEPSKKPVGSTGSTPGSPASSQVSFQDWLVYDDDVTQEASDSHGATAPRL